MRRRMKSLGSGYSVWMTAKKLLIDVVIVGGTGFVSVYSGRPEFLAVIPLVKALINFLKNYRRK